jgi:hypothetical protein
LALEESLSFLAENKCRFSPIDESDTTDPTKQWSLVARLFNRYGFVLAGSESLLLEEFILSISDSNTRAQALRAPLDFISIDISGQFY